MSDFDHETVLLEEAVEALRIKPEGVYVDGTYGRGGHSQMILDKLDRLADSGRLLAIDKDPVALENARARFADHSNAYIYKGSFAELDRAMQAAGLDLADGILLDLGVSSPQLDEAERGFSFRRDGPLDMRMDTDSGITAAQWLAQVSEQELTKVIKDYGEERFARRVARAIIQERESNPIATTRQLAAIVAQAVPVREKGKDPATRTFQAIRIHINHELDDLRTCLEKAVDVLAIGGPLVVISFHSLEDRIVKRFMREQCQGEQFPLDLPIRHIEMNVRMKLIGKPVKPGDEEVKQNPRARSAIMRVAEKIA